MADSQRDDWTLLWFAFVMTITVCIACWMRGL